MNFDNIKKGARFMQLYNLYFLNYNTYYNRIVKKHDNINDYIAEAGYIGALQNINFIVGDGINAEQIINWNYAIPDYMVAVDPDGVLTRWFVIECERTRGGQFKITLKRDVIADNLDVVLNSPTFIEKATLQAGDPFIFNDEGMKVNQILRAQTKLKDETGMAWICAYIPHHKTISGDDPWYERPVNASVSNPQYNKSYETMQEFEEDFAVDNEYLEDYKVSINSLYHSNVLISLNNRTENILEIDIPTNNYWMSQTFQNIQIPDSAFNTAYIGLLSDNPTYKSANLVWDKINAFNNKIVKISDTLYRLTIEQDEIINETPYYTPSTSNLYLQLKNIINPREVGNKEEIIQVRRLRLIKLRAVLTPIIDQSATFTVSQTRRGLKDQPYDMLVFPYNVDHEEVMPIKIDGSTINVDSDAMLNVATKLSEVWGSDVVYDVQMLPYFPCRDLIYEGAIELSSTDGGSKYTTITGANSEVIGVCFYARQSSDTFNIEFDIPFENGKVQLMSEMYRLCSPNYSSAYELRVFENYGINYFNVDFTYLPYQPYIKLNPNFKGLNGIETNDSRGLILGGNYSITTLSSAWANYQLNNTNYQAIFDRQIQNAKTNYKYNLIENVASGIIGGVGQGVASGIATGNVGVGATMGIANAVGLASDLTLNKLKFKESQSYAKDQYNYNLQNIQARPETISKITSFNYNSMYFPFVEFYSCTDEEKEAIENKLRYNGMTVMRIGKIDDYVNDTESFIQGQIIRLENFTDDYHMSVEIVDEIKRGIFIKRSDI